MGQRARKSLPSLFPLHTVLRMCERKTRPCGMGFPAMKRILARASTLAKFPCLNLLPTKWSLRSWRPPSTSTPCGAVFLSPSAHLVHWLAWVKRASGQSATISISTYSVLMRQALCCASVVQCVCGTLATRSLFIATT